MKIKFDIEDEKTVTNETVKITVKVQGQVGEDDRTTLETRAREVVLKFLPNASWAFSNFNFISNGMMFQVTGSTRIDAVENDQLVEKATAVSTRQTILTVQQIDPSIPLFEIRKAQSAMRASIIEKAREEARLLGSLVKRVDFSEDVSRGHRPQMRSVTSNSGSYGLEAADAAPLGHSEKIYMTATVTAVAEEAA